MKVEIWSDVVCPWCYIGKRRFETALDRFEHREQVEVVWRSFELDPGAPARRAGAYADRLAGKYAISVAEAQATIDHMVAVGRGDGVVFDFAVAQPGNTLDAHRILYLALARGVQDVVKERLFAGTFTEGEPIGDHAAVARLAVDAGLDPGEVEVVLAGDAYRAEVRADERRAAHLGITAVPFFVAGGTHAVAGAQPPDLLLQLLQQAWSAAEQAPGGGDGGGERQGDASCADGSCAVTA